MSALEARRKGRRPRFHRAPAAQCNLAMNAVEVVPRDSLPAKLRASQLCRRCYAVLRAALELSEAKA